MNTHEWPANNYAIGSYIQATVSQSFMQSINPKPTDKVLDIGCGDGEFTTTILDKIPNGQLVGLDRSENMLILAREKIKKYPNFSVQQGDILSVTYQNEFDFLVSFWCLQWTEDIELAFTKIHDALKSGGKFFLLFPTGDDPYMNMYYRVKSLNQFDSLETFQCPVNYSQFTDLENKLQAIAFKKLSVERVNQSIELPSLDFFRKFVNGIAFYHGQLPDEEIKKVNEAMVQCFEQECKEKYQGRYEFVFSVFCVQGIK
jgi:ubiquinone/menaquinone biosynthesis C-methylase UbiE